MVQDRQPNVILRQRGDTVPRADALSRQSGGPLANGTVQRRIGPALSPRQIFRRNRVGPQTRVQPNRIDRPNHRSGLLLREVISPKAGLIGLLVNELADAFLTALIIIRIRGLLGTNQIIFGIIIGHLANAAHGVFGCF